MSRRSAVSTALFRFSERVECEPISAAHPLAGVLRTTAEMRFGAVAMFSIRVDGLLHRRSAIRRISEKPLDKRHNTPQSPMTPLSHAARLVARYLDPSCSFVEVEASGPNAAVHPNPDRCVSAM
jgi:hypothetical protein